MILRWLLVRFLWYPVKLSRVPRLDFCICQCPVLHTPARGCAALGVSLPCCMCGAEILVQSNSAVLRGRSPCARQIFTSQSMVKVTLPICLQQASHSASPEISGDLPVIPTGTSNAVFSVVLLQRILGSVLN